MMTCKQGVDGNMVETLKRKLEEERQREEEEEVAAEHDRENEEPVKKKIMVEQVILMKILEISQKMAISKLAEYDLRFVCRNVTSAASDATVMAK